MMTDQPTPTSSLEEARSLDDLWDDYEGVLNAYTFASGADRTRLAERAAVLRDDIKAAARAEVIREVEAARAAALELYEGFDWVGTGTSAGAEREREEFLSRYPWLRALSQGGEI